MRLPYRVALTQSRVRSQVRSLIIRHFQVERDQKELAKLSTDILQIIRILKIMHSTQIIQILKIMRSTQIIRILKIMRSIMRSTQLFES